MRIDKFLQAVLLALALVGIFAAMAKNEYGYTLMGVACLGLAMLYLAQIAWTLITDYSTITKEGIVGIGELFFLSIFLSLFGFRAFYIYIPYGEYVFLGACLVLGLIYSKIGFAKFTDHVKVNKSLAWGLLFLYTSVILFLLSLGTRVFTSWSSVPGALAFLSALVFFLFIARRIQYEIDGKTSTLPQVVVTSNNKAGLLFSFFVAAILYTGLTYLDIIPVIENASRPRAYIELINDAERRRESPVDGKYKHETYKEAMDKFLERHDPRKKK